MRLPTVCAAVISVAAAYSAAGNPQASTPTYQYRVLDFPGAAQTTPFAVNDRGQIVGAEIDSAGLNHAIFDDGRQLQLLDASGLIGTSLESFAFSINNHDDIAGAYRDSSGELHGYVRHPDGSLDHIEFPGGNNTQAFGINDFGVVIGIYKDGSNVNHAFLLREGQYQTVDLPGGPTTLTIPLSINDRGVVAGQFIKTSMTNGFGYLQQIGGGFTLVTAPGSAPEQTFFISINNRNEILGGYNDAAGVPHNFLKTRSGYQPFEFPARFGAISVVVQTVNDFEEIVGYYIDANQLAHGFVATRTESDE